MHDDGDVDEGIVDILLRGGCGLSDDMGQSRGGFWRGGDLLDWTSLRWLRFNDHLSNVD